MRLTREQFEALEAWLDATDTRGAVWFVFSPTAAKKKARDLNRHDQP